MQQRPTVAVEFGDDRLVYDVPTGTSRESFDIRASLGWAGSLFDNDEVLERHAAHEAWWGARHVDEKAIEAEWRENVYDVYMAHVRQFARYALLGQALKRSDVTKQDIDDMIFHLFGESKPAFQRERFIHFSWLGYAQELFGSRIAVERLFQEDRALYDQHYATFYQELFSFRHAATGEPIWREQANRMRIDSERSRDLLEVVARAFHARGFLIKQGAENEKSRRLTTGSMLDDVANRVAAILNLKR